MLASKNKLLNKTGFHLPHMCRPYEICNQAALMKL